ncbi:MAG: type II toxin-antitoxin system MqsA family antitoxin [Terriglobia bacterium]
MNCEVCGKGVRRDKLIRYSLSIRDRLVVVDNVPASVCDRCGETTLSPEVVERLQKTVTETRTPDRMIEIPVYEFA